MIWVALLIGVTILFSARLGRSPMRDAAFSHPRHWLVLPDEPPPVPPRALPVLVAARASWSGRDESWRADRPFRPWLQNPVPYAAAVAFGAVSLDLSALGMDVPEIFPTDLPVHHDDASHHAAAPDHPAGFGLESFEVWAPGPPDPLAGLFDTHHPGDAGVLHAAAWDPSAVVAPSWAPPHEAGHGWWA
jgi:hypothetical protein